MTKRTLSTYSSDIYNSHRETLEMEARLGSLNKSVTLDGNMMRKDGQVWGGGGKGGIEKEYLRNAWRRCRDPPFYDLSTHM
mmetsp:Transcript_9743/g.14621  ORF Transcript_9743/g.14621 Transcript_9743/m.14621 type:complete len:81 (-) Transcript_9743:16-258(-)